MPCWWARAMVESTDTAAMTNLGRFTWRGRHRAGRRARRGWLKDTIGVPGARDRTPTPRPVHRACPSAGRPGPPGSSRAEGKSCGRAVQVDLEHGNTAALCSFLLGVGQQYRTRSMSVAEQPADYGEARVGAAGSHPSNRRGRPAGWVQRDLANRPAAFLDDPCPKLMGLHQPVGTHVHREHWITRLAVRTCEHRYKRREVPLVSATHVHQPILWRRASPL